MVIYCVLCALTDNEQISSRAALILHNAQKVIQQRRTENEEDFDPSSSDMAIAR